MLAEVKDLLNDVLQLGERVEAMNESSALLGAIPELDSMAVVNLIAAMEDRYGFTVADDEINAEVFGTVGTLASFIQRKIDH